MKNYKRLQKAFGANQYGFIDFPEKVSNIKISRIINYKKMGGCSYCFPHGYETSNATIYKNTRSWKKNRKKQWK
ncbi:phosphate ABC transporter substrate-binding protein [Aquimarina sp. D1M17]|uniref:phosphate ABC transporter substrate-binding protein n=1 Tax=Aquimarina acroporae TaxID=2937283 RepID=UPI0020BF99C6|nr:phosphate ABC transporter substrate-binding protein [Aquimarina acroporae]MCK8520444.1 phosphate ABC transporter substrate-binding protein [Aquimarina acroporae]